MMNTDKVWIRDMAEICAAKGIRHAVISPGSRSAPMVIAFNRHPAIECFQIIDERAAGFFALGIAQQTAQPVVLICTSGSAPLNYAPAIAEAYYQRVPLVVLTADRPDELIDQGDGQTIRQKNLYNNYVKKSFHLPVNGSEGDDRWHCARIISEALNSAMLPVPGPVHVNVPLREPLYKLDEGSSYQPSKVIEQAPVIPTLSKNLEKQLQQEWSSFKSKMIIAGMINPQFHQGLSKAFGTIQRDPSVVVLSEATSNLHLKNSIPCIDNVLEAMPKGESGSLSPELVVSLGGEIVSRKIKAFLRTHRPKEHWHVDEGSEHLDTFKSLTKVFGLRTEQFLSGVQRVASGKSDFSARWMKLFDDAKKIRREVIRKAPFCDLTVYAELLHSLPDGCNLHLGNSTPVRYANLFEIKPSVIVNCNRGTSGIDGSMSTAAGAAVVNGKLTVFITGDLAFLYDSNALWNRRLPENLRIIIINNSGGNIFRIIPGPSSLAELEDFFEAKQTQTAEHIAKAFSVRYHCCNDMSALRKQLRTFFSPAPGVAILEIKTPAEASAKVLREYMKMG